MILDKSAGELAPPGAETAICDKAPALAAPDLPAAVRRDALSSEKRGGSGSIPRHRVAAAGQLRAAEYIVFVQKESQRMGRFKPVLLERPQVKSRAQHFQAADRGIFRDQIQFFAEKDKTALL